MIYRQNNSEKKRVTALLFVGQKNTALLKITKKKLLDLLALLEILVDLCVGHNTVTNLQELRMCDVFLLIIK